jgi:hypothetical protein
VPGEEAAASPEAPSSAAPTPVHNFAPPRRKRRKIKTSATLVVSPVTSPVTASTTLPEEELSTLPSQTDFQPPNSLQTVPESTEATSTLATASVSGPVPPPSVVEGEGSKSKKKRAHTVCLPYFNPLIKLDTNSPSFRKVLTLPSFPKLVDPCFEFSLKLPEQIPEPTSTTLRSDVRYNGTQLTRSLKTHTSLSGDAGHPALNSFFVQKAYKGMIFKRIFFRPFAYFTLFRSPLFQIYRVRYDQSFLSTSVRTSPS